VRIESIPAVPTAYFFSIDPEFQWSSTQGTRLTAVTIVFVFFMPLPFRSFIIIEKVLVMKKRGHRTKAKHSIAPFYKITAFIKLSTTLLAFF
jgi:hypothetical protein